MRGLMFVSAMALASVSAPRGALGAGPDASAAIVQLSLLGPRSLGTVEVGYQVMKYLQVGLALGINHASAENNGVGVSASASATLYNPFLVARGFVFGRHSPFVEGGLGITHLSLSAEGHDSQNNRLTYDRGGNPIMGMLGLGYAFRTDTGFQLQTALGYLGYLTGLGTSKVGTSGAMSNVSDADLAEFQRQEDDTSDQLVSAGLYLRLGVGYAF